MLALQKTAPAPGLHLREVPAPAAPLEGEVLVRVEAAGICGSDLHVADFSTGYEFMRPLLPLTLGHEFAGVIEAVGAGAPGLSPGMRVTVWPSSPCGICASCMAGQEQNCTKKRTLGLMRDGAFAPLALARAGGVMPLPEAVDPEIGALTEPLCVAHRAVATAGDVTGARVLVLGPGTIGQGIALMSERCGSASVTIAGFDDTARLGVCRALGFTDLADLATEEGKARLAALADQVDIVFEATGQTVSISDGLAALRMEGTLVLTGIHSRDARFDPTMLVRRKLSIRGSHGSRRKDWQEVVALLGSRPERYRPMISHRLPLSLVEQGFALAAGRQASKVMIFPQQTEQTP